jgi:hypothetical protein
LKWPRLEFFDKKKDWQLHLPANEAKWLIEVFPKLIIGQCAFTLYRFQERNFEGDFEKFLHSKAGTRLRENGLLIL